MKVAYTRTRFFPARMASCYKRTFMASLLLGLAVVMIEGASSFILAGLECAPGPALAMANCCFDEQLGWKTIEHARLDGYYGPGRDVTTGRDGVREGYERSASTGNDRYRICLLGDSFVFGYGVGDDQTIGARLEELEPRIEAVNLGVNGYGLDQCWLRWRAVEERWPCRVLVLGLIADDLYRMELSVSSGMPKPQLVIEDDVLRTIGVPVFDMTGTPRPSQVVSFFEHLALQRGMSTAMRRMGVRSSPQNLPELPAAPQRVPAASNVALRVLREFHRKCLERGQQFVVVYFSRKVLVQHEPTVAAAWLAHVAAEEGISFCDLSPSFQALDSESIDLHFTRDTHFSARGCELAARALLGELRQQVTEVPR